jgi:hypothetical protein
MDRIEYSQRRDGFSNRSRSAYSSYPGDNSRSGGSGYRRF